jgi:hypothetical protein
MQPVRWFSGVRNLKESFLVHLRLAPFILVILAVGIGIDQIGRQHDISV